MRRRYLINPPFQLKVIGWMLGVAAGTVALIYASNTYVVWRLLRVGETLGLPQDHAFYALVGEQKALLNSVFAVTAFVALFVIVGAGVVLSHRIAGPLHRLRETVEGAAEGGPTTEFKVRSHDDFPELAQAINKLLRKASR